MNPKVSEIFKAAGEAFNRLGEMTMQLHNQNETSSKWAEQDIEMLQSAITTFGQDLNKISVRIKDRTASQIRQTITKQVFEEAGIRVQQVNVPQQSPASPVKMMTNNGQEIQEPSEVVTGQHLIHPVSSPTSSEVMMMTLNRLNAQEDLSTDFVGVEQGVEEEVGNG